MGARTQRVKRALQVTGVARRRRLLRVLRELGVVGRRPATREGAVEFRRALEQLGTTYLKLGQLLSSRPDLLPDVYIEELGKLVDEVPPFPFEQVEQIVREDLGEDTLARLDREPLAAASIAQIHTALLSDGREVVLKVRRPGVVEQVDTDLDLADRAHAWRVVGGNAAKGTNRRGRSSSSPLKAAAFEPPLLLRRREHLSGRPVISDGHASVAPAKPARPTACPDTASQATPYCGNSRASLLV